MSWKLGSVENEVVPAKSRRIHYVHWWDGWENRPEDELEDLKSLKSELIAILERTGTNKKVVMEELWKRTREDKTGESVKCLVLAYYKMNSLILGSDLKDTNNFASKVYKMLQLEYFEEHGKFPIEEDKGANEKFDVEEDEKSTKREGEGMNERAEDMSHMIEDTVERKGLCVDQKDGQDVAEVVAQPRDEDADRTPIKGDSIVVFNDIDFWSDDGLGNKDPIENLQMYGPCGYQAGVDEEGRGKTPDRAPMRSPPHSVLEVLPCDVSNRHGWLKVDIPLMVIILIQTPGHYCLECLGDVP